jgi:toxin-antitoxin system PIN domain toxin
MKPCLVDVNVLFPLLLRHHEHHQAAAKWFDGLKAGDAILCRFVQLTLLRLLCNPTIMGEFVLSGLAAWQLVEALMEDERLDFAAEPALMESAFPKLLSLPATANKCVTDTYLAAFAIAGSMRFATFDTGFEQFRGLELVRISTKAEAPGRKS